MQRATPDRLHAEPNAVDAENHAGGRSAAGSRPPAAPETRRGRGAPAPALDTPPTRGARELAPLRPITARSGSVTTGTTNRERSGRPAQSPRQVRGAKAGASSRRRGRDASGRMQASSGAGGSRPPRLAREVPVRARNGWWSRRTPAHPVRARGPLGEHSRCAGDVLEQAHRGHRIENPVGKWQMVGAATHQVDRQARFFQAVPSHDQPAEPHVSTDAVPNRSCIARHQRAGTAAQIEKLVPGRADRRTRRSGSRR